LRIEAVIFLTRITRTRADWRVYDRAQDEFANLAAAIRSKGFAFAPRNLFEICLIRVDPRDPRPNIGYSRPASRMKS
jgi:hypothetical protein